MVVKVAITIDQLILELKSQKILLLRVTGTLRTKISNGGLTPLTFHVYTDIAIPFHNKLWGYTLRRDKLAPGDIYMFSYTRVNQHLYTSHF